jgi:hypothetical protein
MTTTVKNSGRRQRRSRIDPRNKESRVQQTTKPTKTRRDFAEKNSTIQLLCASISIYQQEGKSSSILLLITCQSISSAFQYLLLPRTKSQIWAENSALLKTYHKHKLLCGNHRREDWFIMRSPQIEFQPKNKMRTIRSEIYFTSEAAETALMPKRMRYKWAIGAPLPFLRRNPRWRENHLREAQRGVGDDERQVLIEISLFWGLRLEPRVSR